MPAPTIIIKPYRRKSYFPFSEARELARSMKFTTIAEYSAYARKHWSRSMPNQPSVYYKNDGWVSCYDFLGKPKIDHRGAKREARELRKQGIPLPGAPRPAKRITAKHTIKLPSSI